MNLELVEGGKLPIKGSEGAACFDVYAREIIYVGDFYYKVKLGFKTAIPKGKHAKLLARSGITDTGWSLCNSCGIIDSDFRGEWEARFRPFVQGVEKHNGDVDLYLQAFPYKEGERVAQFMIRKDDDEEINLVDSLDETERGAGGFDSTGRK